MLTPGLSVCSKSCYDSGLSVQNCLKVLNELFLLWAYFNTLKHWHGDFYTLTVKTCFDKKNMESRPSSLLPFRALEGECESSHWPLIILLYFMIFYNGLKLLPYSCRGLLFCSGIYYIILLVLIMGLLMFSLEMHVRK